MQYIGLSFWKTIFVMVVSGGLVTIGFSTGYLAPDTAQRIERSFDEYERAIEREWKERNFGSAKIERACGRPIIIDDQPALVTYSHEFLDAAAKEAEAVKNRAPHIMQMIADYRTLRRAEMAR